MKDYYDILDIPLTASPEQIKAKYKQLVRIYHPDRVHNPDDKRYAERKLKELNEAYAAVSALTQAPQPADPTKPLPEPIVEPRVLDFGLLPPGRRKMARFQVGNVGASAKSITFTCSEPHIWFQVTNGTQLYPDKPVPIQFEVVANTSALRPGDHLSGWVDIHMDGITTRVLLVLQVAELPELASTLPRWMLATFVTCLLLIVVAAIAPWAQSLSRFAWPFRQINSIVVSSTSSASPPAALTPGNQVPDAAPLQSGPASQSGAATSGWSPVFSPDGRQIAFLSDQLDGVQVFARDPQSGRLRQLTNTPEAKAALTWSPDGRKLAFIAGDATRSFVQVVEVEMQATYTLAPSESNGVVKYFLWSPDSQSLIFDFHLGADRNFYRASANGSDVQSFAPPPGWEATWPADELS